MPDNRYPIDAIGNAIKEGALVRLDGDKTSLLFRVIKVDPAGTLSGPNGDAMSLQGTVILQAVVPIKYAADRNSLGFVYVLKEPEQDSIGMDPAGVGNRPALVKQ